ncbi:MAG: hypothetical protein MZU91_01010 [Desulfosudis oleivorans]|nr:hypothetical protein [Desulfosudis oleivorans]
MFLTRGFNWGIDFSGGTMIEVGFRAADHRSSSCAASWPRSTWATPRSRASAARTSSSSRPWPR